MAENNNNPVSADKLLFVTDLINCVMRLRNVRVPDIQSPAEHLRSFFCYGFNEITQTAIAVLDKVMEKNLRDIFNMLQNANDVNSSTYICFAECFCDKYLPDGFEIGKFLIYCMYQATLAAYFCNSGVYEAPSVALHYIVNILKDVDMNSGGWYALQKIAEAYASVSIYSINEITSKASDDKNTSTAIAPNGPSNQNNIDELNEYVVRKFSEMEQNSAVTAEKELQSQQTCSFSENESPKNSKRSIKRLMENKCKIYSPPVQFAVKILNDNSTALHTFAPEPSNVDQISILTSGCEAEQKLKRFLYDKTNLENRSYLYIDSEKQSKIASEFFKNAQYSPISSDCEN